MTNKLKTARKTIEKYGGKAAVQVKDKGSLAINKAADLKEEIDKKRIRPVSLSDIELQTIRMPKLVHIVDSDKYYDHHIMSNAIGHIQREKGMDFLTVYTEYADQLQLDYYPAVMEDDLYIVDPCFSERYLELEQYFPFLVEAKYEELVRIAQDLGAVSFKFKVLEEKKKIVKKNKKAVATKDKGTKVDIQQEYKKSDVVVVDAKTDVTFDGQDPVAPELKYLENDNGVKALIENRLHEGNPMHRRTNRISYNSTTGINEKTAVKIDAVLKAVGLKGNSSFQSRVEEEKRRLLEYTIVFKED